MILCAYARRRGAVACRRRPLYFLLCLDGTINLTFSSFLYCGGRVGVCLIRMGKMSGSSERGSEACSVSDNR
jgi:hypothetical protein